MPLSQVDEPPIRKGERVWVLSGHGLHLPGLVDGYHADRDAYGVVYLGDLAERNPGAEAAAIPAQRSGKSP